MIKIDPTKALVLCFISIALYNFLELNVLIFSIFKSRRSLYFWSFVVSTWGVAFNCFGYLLKDMELVSSVHVYATLIIIGWCSMITGQSVVLYSRLHLVMHNKNRLRAILIMIITNAIWLHIPVIVLVYGANSDNPGPYVKPYQIYEKIQLSVFFIQEVIISGFYVWETVKLLKHERTIGNTGTFGVMNHLIFVNILVILLDVTILGLEFANLYEVQTAWKPLVYSLKLKLEFSILNRLVDLTRKVRSGNPHSYNHATPRSDVALGTLKGTGTQYEVHVGKGQGKNDCVQHKDTSVLRTTEFKIQSHSRRRNSNASLAESGTQILAESVHEERGVVERASASSVSSDIQAPKYDNSSWR
ncbi:hypothetical protein GQ44DRAFT_627130 [Phaeosphaeriaceae sp. PMI808]|nr:hypothetical protein GQ44DRAFT_627130 [Phaeosphaeriaceae sp. PMI808]